MKVTNSLAKVFHWLECLRHNLRRLRLAVIMLRDFRRTGTLFEWKHYNHGRRIERYARRRIRRAWWNLTSLLTPYTA